MNWEERGKDVVHDDDNIRGFFGKYRWLCNFYKCPVMWKGLTFTSTESAYQAAKSNNPKVWLDFVNLEPKDSKSLGRKVVIREDWEDVKNQIMLDVCGDKFLRNKELRNKLIETGDKYLEETNWWGDQYWGVCKGEGKNNLGKTLMKIRSTLNNKLYKDLE